MSDVDDIPAGIDQRVERLMCRSLDGEATAEERAELAGILLSDPAARAAYEEYRQIDGWSRQALQQDVAGLGRGAACYGTRGERSASRIRGWRAGLAAAILTAAAVVAVSVLPKLWSSTDQLAGSGPGGAATGARQAQQPTRVPRVLPYRQEQPYEFINHGKQPFTRLHDLTRDVIGVRGKNDNQIYIFERDRQSTKLVPVSGDI